MPAGYTVCVSCHCPFIFEALKGSEKRCIKGPAAAAARVVKPDDQPEPSSSSQAKPTITFTPTQMAKADARSKIHRSPVSDTNGTLKR
eukprot:7686182-Heterocapsa_arctica.AAC.1